MSHVKPVKSPVVLVTRINSSCEITFQNTGGNPPVVARLIIEATGGTATQRDAACRLLDRIGEAVAQAICDMENSRNKEDAKP